jgi:hypothetical protein
MNIIKKLLNLLDSGVPQRIRVAITRPFGNGKLKNEDLTIKYKPGCKRHRRCYFLPTWQRYGFKDYDSFVKYVASDLLLFKRVMRQGVIK